MVSLGLTLESMGGLENRHFLLREIKSSAKKALWFPRRPLWFPRIGPIGNRVPTGIPRGG